MKPMRLPLVLLSLLAFQTPAFAAVEAGLEAAVAAVQELGAVNGQSLACADMKSAGRAKSLMLAHAPKTARFGSAFDDATQAAFGAQTGGQPCPDETSQTDRLNRIALKLDAVLPVAK